MALSKMQKARRKQLLRAFIGYAEEISNGLSISAPAALLFADADQPITLYDYEAHNLVAVSADFTNAYWTAVNATKTDADTLTDGSAVSQGFVYGTTTISLVAGRQYEFYCRVTQDATASGSGRFPAIWLPFGGGVNGYVVFDTSAANTNIGDITDEFRVDSISVTDVGPGTSWDIKVVFTAPSTISTFAPAYIPAFGASVADLTSVDYASAELNTATGSVDITRTQIRDLSSPDTYTATTGTASTLTASYGDIQLADSKDDGTGLYSPTFTISAGTMTLASNSLLFDVGDGSADATFTVNSETLADINAALRGMTFDTGAAGEATLTISNLRDSDGKTVAHTIHLGSVAALSGATVNNNISSGTTLESVTNLSGATYSIINYTPTLDEATPTVTLDPLDNATDVAVDKTFTMTFNQNVRFVVGGGTIVLKEVGGSTIETFTPSSKTSAPGSASGTCTISTTTVTINPNADLSNSTQYEIIVSAGVIEDYNGNDYGGLATGAWSFTSAAGSSFGFTLSSSGTLGAQTTDLNFGSSDPAFTVNFGAGLAIIMISDQARKPTAVTLDGGVGSATLVAESDSGAAAAYCAIYQATISTPGNYTVTITSAFPNEVNIIAGTLTGANSTATSTASKAYGFHAAPISTTSSLTVTSGIGIAIACSEAFSTNMTWSVGTEISEITDSAEWMAGAATLSTSGSPTVSSHNFGGIAIAAAAWEPA